MNAVADALLAMRSGPVRSSTDQLTKVTRETPMPTPPPTVSVPGSANTSPTLKGACGSERISSVPRQQELYAACVGKNGDKSPSLLSLVATSSPAMVPPTADDAFALAAATTTTRTSWMDRYTQVLRAQALLESMYAAEEATMSSSLGGGRTTKLIRAPPKAMKTTGLSKMKPTLVKSRKQSFSKFKPLGPPPRMPRGVMPIEKKA